MNKWILVGLYPDGRVCAGCVLGYENETEFRQEFPQAMYVPGPVQLGEPLSQVQQATAIKDLHTALNELLQLKQERQWQTINETHPPLHETVLIFTGNNYFLGNWEPIIDDWNLDDERAFISIEESNWPRNKWLWQLIIKPTEQPKLL